MKKSDRQEITCIKQNDDKWIDGSNFKKLFVISLFLPFQRDKNTSTVSKVEWILVRTNHILFL